METTDQLYNQYKGESIPSFDGDPSNDGQCEQWALMVRTNRDGLPIRFGNAIDWWLTPGTDTKYYDYIPFGPGVYPKKDDYVVWGTGVGSSAGHIDVCAVDGTAQGFTGYDSNWQDSKILQIISHNYNYGILGYIRVKGKTVNPTAKQAHDTVLAFETEADGITPHQPTQADLDFGVSTPWPAYIPNFYPMVQVLRDKISLLTTDRDTHLYPFINEVTAALGLTSAATADDCVAAINKLSAGATPLKPGIYKV